MRLAVSSGRPGKGLPTAMDPFLDEIRALIDRGDMARTPGTVFKSHIVMRVQDYSAEVQHMSEGISGLFLELCDLMVNGKLASMPAETFKVYMVILTCMNRHEAGELNDMLVLQEVTGISDTSALQDALRQLEDEGYIESASNPVRKRVSGKKQEAKPDRLFVL